MYSCLFRWWAKIALKTWNVFATWILILNLIAVSLKEYIISISLQEFCLYLVGMILGCVPFWSIRDIFCGRVRWFACLGCGLLHRLGNRVMQFCYLRFPPRASCRVPLAVLQPFLYHQIRVLILPVRADLSYPWGCPSRVIQVGLLPFLDKAGLFRPAGR